MHVTLAHGVCRRGSNAEEVEEQSTHAQPFPADLLHLTNPRLDEGSGTDADTHLLAELQAAEQHLQQGRQPDRQGRGPARGAEDSHEDGNREESMDESMSSHFEFIQSVSTPQELETLLPRLQAALTEVHHEHLSVRALAADASMEGSTVQ